MTEAEWLACDDTMSMLDFLRGNMSGRKEQLFGVACYRRILHLLSEEERRIKVEIVEQLADDPVVPAQVDAEAPIALTVEDTALIACVMVAAAEIRADILAIEQALMGVIPTPRDKRDDISEWAPQARLLCDNFGNPFRPIAFLPDWRTSNVLALQSRCTSPVISPRCRFWPTHFRTPGVVTRRY